MESSSPWRAGLGDQTSAAIVELAHGKTNSRVRTFERPSGTDRHDPE
jgi:hypothetical protein